MAATGSALLSHHALGPTEFTILAAFPLRVWG